MVGRTQPGLHSYCPWFYPSSFTLKVVQHFSLCKSFHCLSFDSFYFIFAGGRKVDVQPFTLPIFISASEALTILERRFIPRKIIYVIDL